MSSPGALPADTQAVETQLIFLFGAWEATTGLLLATSTIAVALRVWVRAGLVKTFGYDDLAMVAAQVSFIICGALSFVASEAMIQIVEYSNNVMTDTNLLNTIRFSNAFYTLTMMLVKVSVTIFFVKLFGSSQRWQRYLIIFLSSAAVAMGVAYLIFTFASCGLMIQSQKTTPFHTGSDWCPVQQIYVNFSIAWSVFNALSDIVFAVLAIGIVWRAQMARSTKISAAILICMGSIGAVASVARIAVQLPVTDVRLSGVLLTIWSNVEAGVCVTAASLIVLRPLFQAAIEKARSSMGSLRSSVGSTRKNSGSSGSVGSKTFIGSRRSKLGSFTSSQKGVAEMIDMDDTVKLNAGAVTVTKTWQVEDETDVEAQPMPLHPTARLSRRMS